MTTTCPVCFGEFAPGYAWYWHKKKCRGIQAKRPIQAHTEVRVLSDPHIEDDDGECAYDSPHAEDNTVSEGALRVDTGRLMAHLMNPEHGSLLRYWDWGAGPLSPKDRDILDFLAVVDGAGGMSTAAASRVLKYVRANGDACKRNLPKSIMTCWKYVERVRSLSAPLVS